MTIVLRYTVVLLRRVVTVLVSEDQPRQTTAVSSPPKGTELSIVTWLLNLVTWIQHIVIQLLSRVLQLKGLYGNMFSKLRRGKKQPSGMMTAILTEETPGWNPWQQHIE